MNLTIIYIIGGILVGGALGFILSKMGLKSKADGIIREAELKGESIKEKKISQAKQKFFELKEKQKVILLWLLDYLLDYSLLYPKKEENLVTHYLLLLGSKQTVITRYLLASYRVITQ